MKVVMRTDLELGGYSIPQINGDQSYTAEAVKEMQFIFQCNVTGQVAMKNHSGELVVFYGIDLDFIREESDLVYQICSYCKGRGYQNLSFPSPTSLCDVCGGSGRVKEEKKE